MQMHNAQQQGERRPKSREKILHPNLSCLAIKYEFHFTRAKYTGLIIGILHTRKLKLRENE